MFGIATARFHAAVVVLTLKPRSDKYLKHRFFSTGKWDARARAATLTL